MPDRRIHSYLKAIALQAGAKNDSLDVTKAINEAMAAGVQSAVPTREDEVFQSAGSSPEDIWEQLVELLPPELQASADPVRSEHSRTKITVRDANKQALAQFNLARVVKQGKFWRLVLTFPGSR